LEFNNNQENEINQIKKINIKSNVETINAFSGCSNYIPSSDSQKLNQNRSRENNNINFDNLQNYIINVNLKNIPKSYKKENNCLIQTKKDKQINSEIEKNEYFTIKNDEFYNKKISLIQNTKFVDKNKINYSNIEMIRKQNSPSLNSKSEITKKALILSNNNNLITFEKNNIFPTSKYSEKIKLNKLSLNPKPLQKKNFTSKEVPIIKMDDNCINLEISKKIKSSNFDKKEIHENSFRPKICKLSSNKDKIGKLDLLNNENLENKITTPKVSGCLKISKFTEKRNVNCLKNMKLNEENNGCSSSDSFKNDTYLTITNINNFSNINITNINNNIFLKDTNLKGAAMVENKLSKNLSKSKKNRRKSNFLTFKENKKKITSAFVSLDITKAKHKHLIKKERGNKNIFSYLYDMRNESKKFKENFSNEIFSKIHTFTPKISTRSLSIQNIKRGKESIDDFIKRLSESKHIFVSSNNKKIPNCFNKLYSKRQELMRTSHKQILKNDKFFSNSERLSARKLAFSNYFQKNEKNKILHTQNFNLDILDNSKENYNLNPDKENSKNQISLNFVNNRNKNIENFTASNSIITTEGNNFISTSEFSNQPLINFKTPCNYKPNFINISEYDLENNILNKNTEIESNSNHIFFDLLNIANNSKLKMGNYKSKEDFQSQIKILYEKDFPIIDKNNETLKIHANTYDSIHHLKPKKTDMKNNESYQRFKKLNIKIDNNCLDNESFKNKNYCNINNFINQSKNIISYNEGDSNIDSLMNTINSKNNLMNKTPNVILTSDYHSLKTINSLKKNNLVTKKLKELKQDEELNSRFQELKSKKQNNKLFMQNKFSKNIDKFQSNSLKEIYDLIEKNFRKLENLQEKGVSSYLIEYLIKPVISILIKRNVELNFENFHNLAKEFIKSNLANAII